MNLCVISFLSLKFPIDEKDIILLSTVRSNKIGDVGILEDPRYLNSSILRAKKGFILVGDF